MSRSFISLQGVVSPFFSELNQQLRQAGHKTHCINFCGGDLLLSLFQPHTNYPGRLSELPGWLAQVLVQHGATDMMLFGDCRAIHQEAIAVAKKMNIRVCVFEEGYLRPDWITLEFGGVNGFSNMPLDPEAILAWTQQNPSQNPLSIERPTGSNMRARAMYDIAYRLANTALSLLFSNYQTHRPHNGFMEYAGLARRFGLDAGFRREAEVVSAKLRADKLPYFLFPLQLNADSQIRTHSPFPDVIASIDAVLASFAEASPQFGSESVQLVIKNHPLDTGLARYRSYVERRSRELNIRDRVKFIEAGDLSLLIAHARGVVLVNSTTGLTALALNCPVYALGKAVFNMDKLTHQGDLASFWSDPTPPNVAFVNLFVSYIKFHSQVHGDFYSRAGRKHAVLGSLQRLLKDGP
jgi:capsular polysaccharide export protein